MVDASILTCARRDSGGCDGTGNIDSFHPVVDDDPDIALGLQDFLDHDGYQVNVAKDLRGCARASPRPSLQCRVT